MNWDVKCDYTMRYTILTWKVIINLRCIMFLIKWVLKKTLNVHL